MRSVSKIRGAGFFLKIALFVAISVFLLPAIQFVFTPQAAYAIVNIDTGTTHTVETTQPGTGGNAGGASNPSVDTGTQHVVGGVVGGEKGGVDSGSKPSTDPFATFGFMLAQVIYIFTVGLGSVIAALAAIVLNYAVQISLDSAAYNLDFVSMGWTILRDLSNMAFIFILVYIALLVMFQAQTHNVVQWLAKVLGVALIINFSFFATRLFIDAGNLVSVQFYNAITSAAPANAVNVAQTPFGNLDIGRFISGGDLTANIMTGINFVSGLSPESFQASMNSGNPLTDFVTSLITFSFVYIVMGAALFMLAAAFIAAGIKFITRIVMLWFSIITAPLALVAWSLNGGGHGGEGGHGNYFNRWLKNLISHAFYPAVFLFVLLIISNFMGGISEAGGIGSVSFSDGSGGSGWQALIGNIANIIVRLGFVLVMLYFALKAGDYFEVAGSGLAKVWGNNFAFGLPGWVGRNTLGRGARFANTRFNTVIGEDGKVSYRSEAAKNLLNLASSSSFDVRSARVPYARDLARKAGIDLPEKGVISRTAEQFGYGKPGGKGGYDAELEKLAKMDQRAIEHGGGAVEAAAIQTEFLRKHFGSVEETRKGLADIRSEIVRLRQQEKRLNDKGAANLSQSEKRQLEQYKKDREQREAMLSKFVNFGKNAVNEQTAHHKQHVVDQLLSSKSIRNQIVARRLGMTKEERKEEKEAEKEHAEHDKSHGGGGGAGAKGGGSAGGGGGHH